LHDLDVDLPAMPKELMRELRRCWMTRATKDMSKWLAVPLHGTTFSGHPTETTLGNTFRSLLYMFYYLE